VVCTNNVLMLYVNGVFARSALYDAKNITLAVNYIGGSPFGSYGGSLDEIRFYDDSLTPDRIYALYNLYLVTGMIVVLVV
jgi:hypothetical protein